MKLLSGHSLTSARYIPAVEMSLQLKERDSTATLTPEDTEGISVGSWLQDDRNPGSGIVWRVRSIQQIYDTKTPQIQLEHAISTLKDGVLFGEHTPAMISGTTGATTCTAKQAVQYILAQSADWTLGEFDYNSVSNPYKFDGDTLFEALEIVTDSLEDAWWSYDFGYYPFKLNITQKSAGVGSEMRAGRNLNTIKKTIDKSGMYTRFYPIGKDDLHIDAQYVEKNTNLYGVISKVDTDQSIDTKAELTRWANERLNKHAQPTVTIDVEGLELADATGEDLDSFELGTICRIPLPEFETTITERIVAISYRDKIRQPEVVTIQLANSRNDVTRIIADEIRKRGRGGRGAARQQQEDHAWFVDTDTKVGLVAEGIVGYDEETGEPKWDRLSQIIADEHGLDLMVQTVQNGVVNAMAQIDITEERILSTVSNVEDGLHSEITQTAGQIQSLVESTLNNFYTEIIQEASQIVIRTGDNTKTYKSLTAPTGTQQDPLVDGDLWFETDGTATWGEALGPSGNRKTWLEDAGKSWGSAIAAKAYRYNGTTNAWEKVNDAYGLLQDTRFEESKKAIKLMAGRVDEVDGESHAHYAELKIEANQIKSTVRDYYNGLSSSITQTAGQIRAEVASSVDSLRSSITVNANKIALVVEGTGSNAHIKPASIVAAINNGSSSIVISADHINLDGYVKATDITANFIESRIATLTGVTLNGVTVNSSAAFNGSLLVAVSDGYASVKDGIKAVQISGPTSNTYKLQYKRFTDSSWQDAGTFSRATTLTGTWGSGAITITASPQGNARTISLGVASGQAYKSGNYLYVPVLDGTTSTGYEAWVNWKNLLTSHSNCVGGLTAYNTSSKVELFYKSGQSSYRSAGSHYWYYRDTSASLTTYYS